MTERFSLIDKSVLLQFLFYPQRRHNKPPAGSFDIPVEVDDGITIVCRAYPVAKNAPWILFFHGNGEVVSDYDGIYGLYNERGINLLVADYRGYGASGGSPTFATMAADALIIFRSAREELSDGGYTGRWLVMGRSLGSISALEIASRAPDNSCGLIIESGFIDVSKLITHLGLPSPGDLKPLEAEGHRMAAAIKLPALVIHGKNDTLVPLHQGKELFEALGSEDKKLQIIPHAGHNDIMFVDSRLYMDAVEKLVLSTEAQ